MKSYRINVLRFIGVILIFIGLVYVFLFQESLNDTVTGLIIGLSLGFLIADRIRPRTNHYSQPQ